LEPSQIKDQPPASRRGALPAAFSSFRYRNYRLWFVGQLVSLIGTWMQSIAQAWVVYQISHSEFVLGLFGFVSAIPPLLISPWAGVVADRFPRRTLLIFTQTCLMVFAFGLAALSFAGLVQIWHILVLGALQGVINAFDAPARQTFAFDLVGRDDISNAIALNSTMFNGARIIGPALGGVLLAVIGASWCFLLNGASFLAVIGGLLLMQFPEFVPQISPQNPFRQMLEGFAYIKNQREILGMLIISVVFSVFGTAYSSQLPAYADQVLHTGETGYGLLNAGFGLGAFVGGAIIAQFGARFKRGIVMTVFAFIFPAFLLGFAVNSQLYLAVILLFSLGFIWIMIFNNLNSLLQLTSSDAMRGRVMSLYMLVFFGIAPFGTLLAGAMAQRVGLPTTILWSGIITTALGVPIFFIIPEIRRLK
jgi:MFS family permease